MADHLTLPPAWAAKSLLQICYEVWLTQQQPPGGIGPTLPAWEALPDAWRARWIAWLSTGHDVWTFGQERRV